MNKLLVCLLLSLIFLLNSFYSVQGQIKKGVYRISGSAGLSLSDEDHDGIDIKESSVQLTGSFNYLVLNYLEAGGLISYNYYERNVEFSENITSYNNKHTECFSDISIGPNLRIYLISHGIIPFLEVSVLYSAAGRQGGIKYEQADYTAGTGFDYFLTKGLALEPFLNYSHIVYKKSTINSFILGVRINYFVL